jgi:DNA-binding Lrp family transcriptional regulator
MDEVDFHICQLLITNSRRSVREIADELGLSVQATHRRLQALEETDSIQRYYGVPSVKALGITTVYIFGRSEKTDRDALLEQLSTNELVSNIYICAGNQTYVICWLRDIAELDALTEFVMRVGEMPSPQIGIIPSMPIFVHGRESTVSESRHLSALDFRIIDNLHYDTRKPIIDIAEELSVSTRTVQRHLDRMINEDLIELTIWFHPRDSNVLTMILHVDLEKDASRDRVVNILLKELGPKLIGIVPFSNRPNHIMTAFHINSMKEAEELQGNIEKEDYVIGTEAYFIYKGDRFPTWRDDILGMI